ncbi:MAG TPA: alpha-amylase [Cryomorphaceae bacterium]|nr:alpha-amylase [Cryomorphaceae bacterium]
MYEVNVRQYTDEGTLQAFQTHLPRLKELGVDILWFMPIQPIGELHRKGTLGSYYSISNYTAVHPDYGTIEDFQSIVEQAHSLGMRVILDWVANHTAFDHHWVDDHPEFYTTDSAGNYPIVAVDNEGNPTDWTDVADLNYEAAGMREEMISEMNWWVTTAGIDGFRCDVAGFVPYGFWKTAISDLRENHGSLFMLAEWEDPALIDAGFNAVYGWEFHHLLNELAQGKTDVRALARYVEKCDTLWPIETLKMYFTTNHDENSWNGTVSQRMGDLGKAMFVLSSMMERSLPLVYTGQEAGLDHQFPFFTKDTIGLDWSTTSADASFFAEMIALKHNHVTLSNGVDRHEMALQIDTTSNSAMITRGKKGSADQVVAIFQFSDSLPAYSAPYELEEVVSVKGARVYAAKRD